MLQEVWSFRHQYRTDKIKDLGFHYSTKELLPSQAGHSDTEEKGASEEADSQVRDMTDNTEGPDFYHRAL